MVQEYIIYIKGNGKKVPLGKACVFVNHDDQLCIRTSSGEVLTVGGNGLAVIKTVTEATYTVLPEDVGKVIYIDRGTAVTVTIPFGLGAGFNVAFIQANTGVITFDPDDEVDLGSLGGALSTSGRYAAASLVFISDSVANLSGALA